MKMKVAATQGKDGYFVSVHLAFLAMNAVNRLSPKLLADQFAETFDLIMKNTV